MARNDTDHLDSGANNLQNFPVLSSAQRNGGTGFAFSQAGLAPSQQLTATATNVGAAETWEFSLNVTVVQTP